MTKEQNVLLEVKNISKCFWREKEPYVVLDNVSFALQEKEFFVLLGRSGCGKTTLLRCMGGFSPADQGEILLQGKKVEKPGADRMMVFQDFNQLFPWMTLKKNLTYAMKKACPEKSKEEREKTALEFLEAAGLKDFENQYPSALSGGMKQRGALARALALNPKVLLMDEPFSSLDYLSRLTARKTVFEMAERTGCTVFMVTHDIEDAVELGTQIGILNAETHRMETVIHTAEYSDKEQLKEQLKQMLLG